MSFVNDIMSDLERDEGFVSHAYRDSEGYLTIGFGRLIDHRLGGGITKHEARQLLTNDVSKTFIDLDNNIPWWRKLSPPRQRAIVNMCFNLGINRFMGFKNMLKALQDGDYHKAADEALDSKWAIQVGSRAQRIADLIRNEKL